MIEMIEFVELEERMRTYGTMLDASFDTTPPRALREPAKYFRARPSKMGLLVCVLAFLGSVGVVFTATGPGDRPIAVSSSSSTRVKVPSGFGFSFPVDASAPLLPRPEKNKGRVTTEAALDSAVRVVMSSPDDGGALRIRVQAAVGSPVLAITTSRVARVVTAGGVQRVILEDAHNGVYTYDDIVPADSRSRAVAAGEVIGSIADSPNPGFDLQIAVNGSAVNPLPIIAEIDRLVYAGSISVIAVQGISVSPKTAVDLKRLLAAAASNGVFFSGGGYRSPATQLMLRRNHCGPTIYDVFVKPSSSCEPPTALAGSSSHAQGIAVDFTVAGRALIRGSEAYRWLRANAARYNFTQPNPGEPWHWEHRNDDLAKARRKFRISGPASP
jgi:hypothetical protein